MGKSSMRHHVARELVSISVIRGLAGPGLNSSLGIFFPTVAAMLGVGVGTVSWSVSIASLAGMLFLPVSACVFRRLGVRVTSLLGVLLVSLSYLLHAFASHILWWYVLAVPFGIGTVLVVNLLGPLVLDGEGVGLGSSLGRMMTIAGVVAIPIQPLVTSALSHGGVRLGYLLGGGVAFLVMLPCVFVLPGHGEERNSIPRDGGKALHRGEFILLYCLLAVIVASNCFHQHITALGLSQSIGRSTVATGLTLSMIGAAAGGLLLGSVTHHFGGASSGYLTLALGGTAAGLFLLGGGGVVFMTACFLHGTSSAAIGITAQTLARERCEGEYGQTLARLLTAIPLATILATPLWGMIYDLTADYRFALWCILGLQVFGAGCLFIMSCKKGYKKEVLQ